jgi:hypothetical protein
MLNIGTAAPGVPVPELGPAGATIIVTAAVAELAVSYLLIAVIVTEGTVGGLGGAV